MEALASVNQFGMVELREEELMMVDGGDHAGNATAAGSVAFGVLGYKAATKKGSLIGAKLGAAAGPVGIAGGAILGGVIGFTAWTVGRHYSS